MKEWAGRPQPVSRLRKVRTPQGRTLGKVPGGVTRGKCNREQTADGLRAQVRVKG